MGLYYIYPESIPFNNFTRILTRSVNYPSPRGFLFLNSSLALLTTDPIRSTLAHQALLSLLSSKNDLPRSRYSLFRSPHYNSSGTKDGWSMFIKDSHLPGAISIEKISEAAALILADNDAAEGQDLIGAMCIDQQPFWTEYTVAKITRQKNIDPIFIKYIRQKWGLDSRITDIGSLSLVLAFLRRPDLSPQTWGADLFLATNLCGDPDVLITKELARMPRRSRELLTPTNLKPLLLSKNKDVRLTAIKLATMKPSAQTKNQIP